MKPHEWGTQASDSSYVWATRPSLLISDSSLRLDWSSPSPDRNKSITLDLTTAAEALRIAEQVTSEMGELKIGIGYFVGVELLRKTFTAVLEAEEETYRGRISDAAMVAAAHLTLNESYLITIRETLEVSSSGEEKPRYEVEKIEALNGRTFEQSPV